MSYWRAHGSLNRQGYNSEMAAFYVTSSDNDNSDSSNNSSDCVIISASSFKGKQRPLLLSPAIVDFSNSIMDVIEGV
jgi:hypothetical protein